MRVLIVGPTFYPWDLGTYLQAEFRKRTVPCSTFAYRTGASGPAMNQALREAVASFAPTHLLGLKMGPVSTATLRHLRQQGIHCTLWYMDCFTDQVPPAMKRLVPEVDLFLTTAAGMVPAYQALGSTPVHWLIEGVHLPAFGPQRLAAHERTAYGSEVAFIGNIFHPPAPDPKHGLRRYRLLNQVGRSYALKVWGTQGDVAALKKWNHRRSPIIGWPAYNEVVGKICRGAKVVLGINTVRTVERYFSNRTYLTLASGGFHLTEYVPGLENMFENHRHLVWFRTNTECMELIDLYLSRPRARARIAREGREWARRRYSMSRQVGKLLKLWEGVDR